MIVPSVSLVALFTLAVVMFTTVVVTLSVTAVVTLTNELSVVVVSFTSAVVKFSNALNAVEIAVLVAVTVGVVTTSSGLSVVILPPDILCPVAISYCLSCSSHIAGKVDAR